VLIGKASKLLLIGEKKKEKKKKSWMANDVLSSIYALKIF
jgi:hypothetical protein